MSREFILSIIAFATLCGSLAILLIYVPRLDLGAVVVATLLLCAYDILIHRSQD